MWNYCLYCCFYTSPWFWVWEHVSSFIIVCLCAYMCIYICACVCIKVLKLIHVNLWTVYLFACSLLLLTLLPKCCLQQVWVGRFVGALSVLSIWEVQTGVQWKIKSYVKDKAKFGGPQSHELAVRELSSSFSILLTFPELGNIKSFY